MEQVLQKLKQVKGLSNFNLLHDSHKKKIIEIEEDRNLGIKECLNRQFTLLLTHDSSFRPPTSPEVIKKDNKITFPSVQFPEVEAKDVVSSSPSKLVNDFLVKEYNLKLKDEATLHIGFNL